MNRILIVLILSFLSLSTFSQLDKHSVSIEMEYGIHRFQMKEFNKSYHYNGDMIYAISSANKIYDLDWGRHLGIKLNFRAIGWYEVGLLIDYSNSKVTEHQNLQHELLSNATYKAENWSFGVSNSFILNKLFKMNNQNSISNRLNYGVELDFGLSKGGLSLNIHSVPYVSNLPYVEAGIEYRNLTEYFSPISFYGQFGGKLEYNFIEKPFVMALGARLSYRFYKKVDLFQHEDNEPAMWLFGVPPEIIRIPMTLDFSGFYGGVYLKIGK